MVNHSIFNDVLGPVMAGPSSSHSAGCARIGLLTRYLWGKDIRKAVVVYDSQGSYPSTCVGQGSNFGFTGGLLGLKNGDPRMKDSIAIAKETGVDISFAEEVLSARHPNEARIDVYGDDGQVELSVLTLSIGGGMFRIVEMDGYPVELDGSREMVLVCCEDGVEETVREILEHGCSKVTVSDRKEEPVHKQYCLICGETACDEVFTGAAMVEIWKKIGCLPGVRYIRKAPVVLPIPMKPDNDAAFSTAEEALRYMDLSAAMVENREHTMELWELAIDYECSIGEVTREEVWSQAEQTLEVMRNAAKSPDPLTTEQFGFLPYQSADMRQKLRTVKTVPTGYLEKAMFYALAVMENSCAHNIVTASPTAGSSGVVPAAVVAVGEEMGCSDAEIIKGLLAAGLAGAFIANQATFGAEVAGCQAENGAASAMAAAGVVQLLGGTVPQGFAAASLALQNMLGLICDPVGGVTEIPCISRNVAAMSNAVMSANMVMLGFDPVIPFDETIVTMLEVGKQLPSALRCTCEGGLCATKTGRYIAGNMPG